MIIFRDVVTKERYKAVRVTDEMADAIDAETGQWMIQHIEGLGPVKIITAVQSVTEFEEIKE